MFWRCKNFQQTLLATAMCLSVQRMSASLRHPLLPVLFYSPCFYFCSSNTGSVVLSWAGRAWRTKTEPCSILAQGNNPLNFWSCLSPKCFMRGHIFPAELEFYNCWRGYICVHMCMSEKKQAAAQIELWLRREPCRHAGRFGDWTQHHLLTWSVFSQP